MHSFLRRLLPFIPGLLVMVVTIHFGLTLAYVMPLNPIVLQAAPVVHRYISPWFIQDWHLFAPNPANETRILLISCRLLQPNGAAVEAAWADVSTPLWNAQARQRFSAAAWLVQPQAHVVHLYFDENEILATLTRQHTAQNLAMNQSADKIRAAEDARRALASHVLARLSAAYCDSWYGANRTVATRARVVGLRFPRFSQRQLPDTAGEMRYYTFDWMPYEWVAPMSLLG